MYLYFSVGSGQPREPALCHAVVSAQCRFPVGLSLFVGVPAEPGCGSLIGCRLAVYCTKLALVVKLLHAGDPLRC